MTVQRFRVLSLAGAICAVLLTIGTYAFHLAGPPGEAAGDPVIGAAGDIACDPADSHFNDGLGDGGSNCRQKYTSDLLVNKGLAGVLALGDNQYYCGGYQAFLQSYDLSWGRVKSITHPAVGNHEFLTAGGTDCTSANQGAAGYFQYFGTAAGSQGQGYYSYDIGTWHLIALNTNCADAGGCGSTSPQGRWLQADLAAHTNYCTLAYWHIPRFSSGGRANANSQQFWNQLYAANADVILASHDHLYERFAPQAPNGSADPDRGIREFIVGTGGANATSLTTIAANSEVRNDDTAGVLKLTLHPTSYDWQFVPEAGKTFTDSGTTQCHGTTITDTPTSVPTTTSGPSTTPTPTTTSVPTMTPAISATATPTPTATSVPGSTLAVTAIADAYVSDAAAATNYGTLTTLRVDGSPLVRSYLRFNVQGIAGAVSQASLRVFANSAQSGGYEVHGVADTSWGETAITSGNAPPFAAASAGSSGSVSAGTWTTADVTSLITGNGLVSLALMTTNTTALSLASRESGANAPQLVIVTAAASTATASPIATDTQTATPTPSPSATASTTPNATPTVTLAPTQTSTPTDTLTPTQTSATTATFTPTQTSAPPNTPTPPGTPTPTATPAVTTLAFVPNADAYVSAGVTTNTGTGTTLRVDGSPLVRSYLRFNVQGITGAVSQASLRIFANSAQSTGYEVHGVADTSWNETAIVFTSAPAFAAPSTGSSGAVSAGTWTTVDVTSLITGNGLVSLALITPNTTALSLASRESGANAPQLIIVMTAAPGG